jgi:hypothetical protein
MQGGGAYVPYKTVEQELAFFRQWYMLVFDELGITEKRAERADYLVAHLWYLKKQLYSETIGAFYVNGL